MAMKNPAHPGYGVAEALEALGVGTAQAAAHMRISRAQLHRVITGRSAISPEMAIKLEQAIGGTAESWLAMQRNYDLAQARKVCTERIKPLGKAA